METYYNRFNDVLKYIHFHLEEKLDLEKLASIALVSKYHFHRMIKSYLGESIGIYINRIRVEKGAQLLKYSDNSVSEIAYKVGYDTPTSFNKSFKKRFGISPLKFRKNPNHSFKNITTEKENPNFNLKIQKKKIADILILTHQSKGLIGGDETDGVWNELMSFAGQKKLLSNKTNLYGIHWDDPSITIKEYIRYDACISIETPVESPRFVVKKIKGGNYLCFTYKGDYRFLGDVYHQIFRDYILTKDIILREAPLFDQYLNDKIKTPVSELLTEIYVPI